MSIQDISLPSESRNFSAAPNELDAVTGVENEPSTLEGGCIAVSPSTEAARGNRRDLGWWLLLDLFVRQGQWTRIAMSDPTVMQVSEPAGDRIVSSMLKRGLDCTIALLLLVVFFPLFIVIAVVIRLESCGPALFCHSRVGKDGKTFIMWKFRSMLIDSPRYELSPTSNRDKRLTRIGQLIRRISLDELPQLLNVLKGDMSLVGPRPEMPFIVDGYGAIERQRLVVKPGVTGLWQISPCRAAPIHQNLQYDFYYIQNRNMFLDAAILLRTVSAIIRGVGAV